MLCFQKSTPQIIPLPVIGQFNIQNKLKSVLYFWKMGGGSSIVSFSLLDLLLAEHLRQN